jgi:hypothetical protein
LIALHPFFSLGGDPTGRFQFWDILYPLAGSRTGLGEPPSQDILRRRWVLPFYFQKLIRDGNRTVHRKVLFPFIYLGSKTKTLPEADGSETPSGARYFVLFPFIWDIDPSSSFYIPISNREAGRSYALFPFFGRFRKVFDSDELTFILWPLWIKSTQGPNHTWTLGWPFFSRTAGPEENRWRFWPLWDWKQKKGVGSRTSYLWPLGHHVRRQAVGSKKSIAFDAFLPFFINSRVGESELKYIFPFWGQTESPNQKTVTWLWPLYLRTHHTDPDWTQTRILHFIVNFKGGEQIDQKVVFPLFGQQERPQRRSRFALFPFLFERHDQKATGDRFERLYLFPFYANERWIDQEGDLQKHRRGVFPLWRSIQRSDGSREFSAPHLWWYTEQPGILRNWAPLWTLYSSKDDGQGTRERRFFWRLWRSKEIEGVGVEREINFLVGRYRKPIQGPAKMSLLGIEWSLGR